ncbi:MULTISPECIES: phage holin family protein [Myroides]|uniref:Phage holin family protein n=1 Tax=Myroides albus TaxID=2562892 RepID=A0A6I3LGW6_9FLAO|nr:MULTISPECIES: phage holin family protein [Myroides]MTG96806.1 phage holin family protein [Myroides albus]MVX34996.1 phage holin family protein [Myroides sp. LoEW2-1]UVD78444.1 phage holin family protein [Myroides albus]
MNFIIRLLITTALVMFLCWLLPGVSVDGWTTALWVAVAMGLLNAFLKPILVFMTLPATIVTLGLFLLVINAVIIQLTAYFVKEFTVDNFWYALLFSIVLTFCQSIVNGKQQDDRLQRQ